MERSFFVGIDREFREVKEIREDRAFKDFQEREGNFLSEGSRCGLDKEVSPDG